MRQTTILLALLATAAQLGCGTDESGDGPGFSIRTPDFAVAPGEEKIVCYRFKTGNTAEMAIKRWTSTISPNVVSARLFLDGTSQTSCGFGDGKLTYIAYRSTHELTFPANDGSGKPVAQILPARQAGFVVLHIINPTSDTIVVHARFEATGYPSGTKVTRADPLVTFQQQISIPTTGGHAESATCDTPADATFFAFTTFTFARSTHTFIVDGGAAVFAATNNADPGALVLHAPPFYTFNTGRLTYLCEYANPGNNTIFAGDNPATSEQCVALLWHFPSTGPRFCLDNQLI